MHCLALQRDPAGNRSPVGDEGMLFDECPKLAGGLLVSGEKATAALYGTPRHRGGDRAIAGVAEPGGRFGEGIERLQIEGRAADDLEYVAGRGLVFEPFRRSPVRSRRSSRRRAFSIAITALAAKFCNS